MPSRVANKAQWAFQDIMDEMASISKYWDAAMARAEVHMDIALINSLARMRDRLAVVERKASDGLRNEYRQ